jgi:hypothetical protein
VPVVEEFLNYDWDQLCLLCHGDVLSKIVWITGDMPLMIGGVHQFFLTTTLHTMVY